MQPVIRRARAEQMVLLQEWAVREGWGAGEDDGAAFHAADPEGFLIAWDGDRAVGSVSAVRYEGGYHFIGYYIVDPQLRRRGIEHALFDAALDRVDGGVAGLDAVPAQVETYRSLGFEPAHVTTRHVGDRSSVQRALAEIAPGALAPPASAEDLDALVAYDGRNVPAPRPSFVKAWLDPASRRRSFVIRDRSAIRGLATVRPAVGGGTRIGPLFADDTASALAMLSSCVAASAAWGSDIAIDVHEGNTHAVNLVRSLGLEPTFSCTRMYRGEVRDVPSGGIWGNATFELG